MTAPRLVRQLAPLLGLLVVFAGLAALAIGTTRLSGGIALLWLATAPVIVVLGRQPTSRWTAPLVAAALASLLATLLLSPLRAHALAFCAANMAEALIAAWLLRRWGAAEQPLATPMTLAKLVLAAGLIAPAISGIVTALALYESVQRPALGLWVDWLMGHGLGSVLGVPLAAVLIPRRRQFVPRWSARQLAIASGLALLVGASTLAVFSQQALPLLFAPTLPVVIATMALRREGAAAAVMIVAAVGGAMTLTGHGPMMLIDAAPALKFQFFQFYLAVQLLIALPIAATLTQRDALMRALGDSEARYRMVTDEASDIILTLSPEGTIRFASPAIREIGGVEPETLIGSYAIELVHHDDRARAEEAHWAALARPGTMVTVEYRAIRAGGTIGWFETNTRAVRGEDGKVEAVVSIVRDLDRRKRREAELEHAAATDPLTGLLNRPAFAERLATAVAEARERPAVLAMLDLDRFKAINDTYGHQAGDAVLLAVADLLREGVRPGDAVARMGGEEFAILFSGVTLPMAGAVAERLRARLAASPIGIGRGSIAVTVSAGLAAIAPDMTAGDALAAADRLLYTAKAEGRDRVALAQG